MVLLCTLVVYSKMFELVKRKRKLVLNTGMRASCIMDALFALSCFVCVVQWAKLADPDVWRVAATQIFYSLGLGFGGLVAYASYSKPDNDTLKDSIFITLVNSFTSIFGAVVIFSILGHLSYKNNIKLSEV